MKSFRNFFFFPILKHNCRAPVSCRQVSLQEFLNVFLFCLDCTVLLGVHKKTVVLGRKKYTIISRTHSQHILFSQGGSAVVQEFLRWSLMWLMQLTGVVFVHVAYYLGHWGKLRNSHVIISFCTCLRFSRPLL